MFRMPSLVAALAVVVLAACTAARTGTPAPTLPPDVATARDRLAASPRHGEWVMINAGSDSVRAWVVFPERKTKAPVVVVVHEIYGLTPWVRSIADQLAADGFIAIAPDLLTSKNLPNPTDSVPGSLATAAIRTLDMTDVHRQISAAAEYAMALPAALPRYGIVGYCWGGSVSFEHAVRSARVAASVVYYGTSPQPASLSSVRAPVLGLYGGNDARVNATIAPADTAMRALNKTYTYHVYEGAGHGFLRAQAGQEGANMKATQQAWPATIAWFRRHLGE